LNSGLLNVSPGLLLSVRSIAPFSIGTSVTGAGVVGVTVVTTFEHAISPALSENWIFPLSNLGYLFFKSLGAVTLSWSLNLTNAMSPLILPLVLDIWNNDCPFFFLYLLVKHAPRLLLVQSLPSAVIFNACLPCASFELQSTLLNAFLVTAIHCPLLTNGLGIWHVEAYAKVIADEAKNEAPKSFILLICN